MVHPFLPRTQIREGVWVRLRLARNSSNHFDAGIGQSARIGGIIRQKANTVDAELAQDRNRQTVNPAVRLEPQDMIGLHGVDAAILQFVRFDLRHQANTAPFLKFVDHESLTFRGNGAHGHG